jgi:hypothetical protein
MTKTGQNVEFWAGDDVTLRFGITASDGTSQDMTGNTASWILQDEVTSTCISVQKAGTISGSLVDVVISGSDDTATLSGFYYHELAAAASGSAVTLATGTAKINKSSI